MKFQEKEISVKLDQNNFMLSPSQDEFQDFLNGMKKVETHLHHIKFQALIKMKDTNNFSSIVLEHSISKDLTIKSIIEKESRDIIIVYKNKEYKGFETALIEVKELYNELGYTNSYVFGLIDAALLANKGDDYAEAEVSIAMIVWLVEQLSKGLLDAFEQFKIMVLSSRGKADIDSALFPSFYNTFKDDINRNKPIDFEFMANEAEMSKFYISY